MKANWLGWLGITDDQISHQPRFKKIAEDTAGFKNALLLGMGGSSLCVEVMKLTYGSIKGRPEMVVLDSTDPAQVREVEGKVDLANTICIVSSKSGSTLEPNIFKQYFYDRVKQKVGAEEAGKRFIAITDSGSKMQQVAEHDGFRHIFYGLASIGGRYSALSNFGMIPAAIQGVDVLKFLDRVEEMVHACASVVPADQNPGVILGAIMGTLANGGRDKVTIFASPGIADIGAWLEQLLAESTGKDGKGLIPVDRESIGAPGVYGNDRLFAYLRLETTPDAKQDAAVAALDASGPAGRPHRRAGHLRSWARKCCAGKLLPPLLVRSSESMRSISRTSKPARSPLGNLPPSTKRTARFPRKLPSSPTRA